MALSGIHLILTYRCTAACEHCFVHGGPANLGVMSDTAISSCVRSAKRMGTVTSLWIEGGEPFLYPREVALVTELGSQLGFSVGALTNAFWAKTPALTLRRLAPLADRGLSILGVSTDQFHRRFVGEDRVENALAAAERLGLKGSKMVTQWDGIMFRGRAAEVLADKIVRSPWHTFDACSRETIASPRRVHVDCHGLVHLCQGLVMEGSARDSSLEDVVRSYDSLSHPIAGLIYEGGPALLTHEAMRMGFEPGEDGYADCCHLCYSVRKYLRRFYPELLGPDEVYGISEPAAARLTPAARERGAQEQGRTAPDDTRSVRARTPEASPVFLTASQGNGD